MPRATRITGPLPVPIPAGAPPAGTAAGVARVEAAVHGSTVVFWWAAAILAAGALVTALLFERPRRTARPAEGCHDHVDQAVLHA